MAKKKSRFSDEQLLTILSEERRNSIGFENDAELARDRDKSLEYLRGEMKDVKSLKNRSSAVSTDVADAIETVLPDILEIFTGGEDIVSFLPQGEEDVDAAAQETDYLTHVIFSQNPGFMILYTAFKDALTVKTGVFKYWWEEYKESVEERFENKSADELALWKAIEGNEVLDIEETPLPEGYAAADYEQALYSFTIRQTQTRGCAKYDAVPPEDFTVGRDTVFLSKATYCAYRTRPRVQDLIADGYDEAKVRALPEFMSTDDETTHEARDTVGETEKKPGTDNPDLRTVEIVEHYLRIDCDGDGKPEIWRIVTGGDEKVLLLKEERPQIEFAAITPFINPHRFYGTSLADKLIEIQKIKTALVRMLLDSGYFALNRRPEVNETQCTPNTIPDLLRNEPGVPIRSKGEAIKWPTGGELSFDVTGALEYISTMGEQRTGVVRNAQGLNPDTLHDTAKGAMALMNAAQRRVRMIARIFAETGVKDLFLGLHALIRQNATAQEIVRLRGDWTPIDPTSWGSRKDMAIEIGVGSGGKEQELAIIGQVLTMQESIIQMQGGPGPLVSLDNVYNALMRFTERGGLKSGDDYFSNPAEAPPQEPQPDPEVMQAQQELQLEREKAEADAQLERFKAEQDLILERERMAFEQQMAEAKAQFEARMAEQKMQFDAMIKARSAEQAALSKNRAGGRLDA